LERLTLHPLNLLRVTSAYAQGDTCNVFMNFESDPTAMINEIAIFI
jgi:hypothetical protein